MQAFVELADRQLVELEAQKAHLEETMNELRSLRDETAGTLDSR